MVTEDSQEPSQFILLLNRMTGTQRQIQSEELENEAINKW